MNPRSTMTLTATLAISTLALTACGGGAESSAEDNCTPRDEISTSQEGTLTVALTNTPPYSIEEDGEVSGIDGDIVRAFAEAQCLELEHDPYTYATAIPAIEQARADISTGGFYRTAERAEVVTLSDPLYLDELSVYAENGISTVDELDGLTIGTVEGYLWVDDLNNLDGVETRVFSDSLTLAQDLDAGRVQAALDGYGAATVATQDEDFEINVLEEDERVSSTEEPSQAAVLLDPNNDELTAAFNSFVDDLREDGTLVDILADYDLPDTAAEVGDARLID